MCPSRMRLVALFTTVALSVAVPITALADCALTESGNRLIMENEHLKLTVQPDKGAAGISLVYKRTKDVLTSWPNHGVVQDRFWIAGHHNNFFLMPYSHKVIARNENQVSVAFSCSARSAGFADLSLEKTITLHKAKSVVEVNLKLTNQGKHTLPIGLWAFQDLRIPGKTNFFFAPTARGVDVVRHYPVKGGKGFSYEGKYLEGADRFLYNFSRGWNGVVSESGVGAVCMMQPEHVSCLYNWFGKTMHGSTLEWIYNRFDLMPGKSWQTRYTILPLFEFKSLDGAGDNVAGGIAVGKVEKGKTAPVHVKLISGAQRRVNVSFLVRRLPDNDLRLIRKTAVKLDTGQPVDVTFEMTAGREGTHVLRFEIHDGDRLLFDMERPIAIGESSGTYALARNFKSLGQEMTVFKKTAVTSLEQTVLSTDGRAYLDHELSMAYVTPHIKWCKPYHRGKSKLLMSVPISRGESVRQIIEVAQRMDADFDAVIHRGRSSREKSRVCGYEEAEWKKKLKGNFDVLLMNSTPWGVLTEEIKTTILKKVEQGMGMVVVRHPWGMRWDKGGAKDPLVRLWMSSKVITKRVADEVPIDIMPRLQEKDLVRLADHGKGRVVFLHFYARGLGKSDYLIPSHSSDEPGGYRAPKLEEQGFPLDEYRYSMLIKTVLLAAGKEPDVKISMPLQSPISASALAQGSFDVSLQSPRAFRAEIGLVVRDAFNREYFNHKQSAQVKQGRTDLSFPAGLLSGGMHVIDVQVKDDAGKVVAWASRSITVQTPAWLSGLTLSRHGFRDGETVEGKVTLEADGQDQRSLSLVCELCDHLGRVTARETVPIDAAKRKTEAPVRLRLTNPLTRPQWVKAKLYHGERMLYELREQFFTAPRDEVAFHLLDCGEFSTRRTKELGFTGTVYHSLEALQLDMAALTWTGFPNIYIDSKIGGDATGTVRKPCLSDPKFLAKVKDGLNRYVEQDKRYNFIGYIFADEWKYGGRHTARSALCHSPSCVKGFRKYLQKRYGKIAALNAAWGADHKTFSNIVPVLPAEVNQRIERVKRGQVQNFVDWLDHKMYVESVVADFMDFCNKATGYKIKIGLSGTQRNAGDYFVGLDWWKLAGKRKMRCVVSYGGAQIEIMRSFMHPDDFLARWGGGYDQPGQNEKHHRQGPWGLLFRNADACAYGFFAAESPMLFPDLTPRPHAAWVNEQVARIGRGGIGKLIKESNCVGDGVAIHYSQASIHANRLLRTMRGGIPTLDSNWDSWVAVLGTLGLQFDFVSYEQIENGKLRDYKVLVMPFSYVVSPKERERIEEFVRAGGTVIADVVCPEFGAMFGGADVTDIFGIEQKGLPTLKLTRMKTADGSSTAKFLQGSDRLTPAEGKAQSRFENDVPAIVVNRIGQGRAICLNLAIADYRTVSLAGAGGEIDVVAGTKLEKKESIEKTIRSVLAMAGVKPEIKATVTRTGKSLDAQFFRFRDGHAEYAGIMSLRPGSGRITEKDHEPVKINFGRKAHVYDVIRKKYLGLTDEIAFTFVHGETSLFALLPERPTGIKIGVKTRYSQGEMMTFPVRANGGHSGVVLVSLLDADGVERYHKQVHVADGSGSVQVPLALNDPPGKWSVKVNDVVTGTEAEKAFSLKAK